MGEREGQWSTERVGRDESVGFIRVHRSSSVATVFRSSALLGGGQTLIGFAAGGLYLSPDLALSPVPNPNRHPNTNRALRTE